MSIVETFAGEGAPKEGYDIWEQFTIRDGLPDMKIESLFEDSQGNMWIGTHDRGVVRYDGYEFETFSREHGMAGDGVFSILEDGDGNMWFGTNAGLLRYDGSGFEQIEIEEQCSFLWGSCMDEEGNLWFGLERRPGKPAAVCRWSGDSGEIRDLGTSQRSTGSSIHAIVNWNGDILCGGHGLYACTPQETREYNSPGKTDDILDMVLLSDLSLLTVHREVVYISQNADPNGSMPLSLGPDIPTAGAVACPDGTFWITDLTGNMIHADIHGVLTVQKLEAPLWRPVCIDRNNRIWAGTYGAGLLRGMGSSLSLYNRDHALPSDKVRGVGRDGDGRLWVGTTAGLVAFTGDDFEAGEVILPDREITSLICTSNGAWIGTRWGQVYHVNDIEIREYDCVRAGNTISALAEDDAGCIWFTSRLMGVLGYYDETQNQTFVQCNHPQHIEAMAVTDTGVWVGSASVSQYDGLAQIAKDNYEQSLQFEIGFPILSLCSAGSQGVWVGTNHCLLLFDEKRGQVTTEVSLPCAPRSLSTTRSGSVMIGTEGGGVFHFDGEILQQIELPDSGCNYVHDIFEDTNGDIWLSTDSGLVRYRPLIGSPSVEITEIVADGDSVDLADVSVSCGVGRVVISYRGRSQNGDTKGLVYRSRLDGQDEIWHKTRDLTVEYSRLVPGEYHFQIQVVDRDLRYSDMVQLPLTVTTDPRVEALNDASNPGGVFGRFVGDSKSLRSVERQIQQVAQSDLTVLILGETGTGKGIAARMIHASSPRRHSPFVQVNCGTLQETLVDSELFGHEKGSFTGAVARKLGKFELAKGGTVFLDEIGDLPLSS